MASAGSELTTSPAVTPPLVGYNKGTFLTRAGTLARPAAWSEGAVQPELLGGPMDPCLGAIGPATLDTRTE